MNEFGCPDKIYEAMRGVAVGPLFIAAKRLGPERVQWIGTPSCPSGGNYPTSFTCWALDGKRATNRELYEAAGLRLEDWGGKRGPAEYRRYG